jgi:hypothetical protein
MKPLVLFFALTLSATAQEKLVTVESATRLGLSRVKQAASDWQTHKTCFSCHHQTLPMLAAVEGERAGLALDKAWLKSQADTTLKYFEERIDDMDEGDHVPGRGRHDGIRLLGPAARSAATRPDDHVDGELPAPDSGRLAAAR